VFPETIEDVPDIIFYFCDEDEEYKRMSYFRIPAKELLLDENTSKKQ